MKIRTSLLLSFAFSFLFSVPLMANADEPLSNVRMEKVKKVKKAKKIPLVYKEENTGAMYPALEFPSFYDLPVDKELRSPLQWFNSSGVVQSFGGMGTSQNEIACAIQVL